MKSTSYSALKKIWYAKLKKSGFNDIEMPDGDLKGRSTEFSRDRATYQYGGLEAKGEYNRLANFFLQEHEFASRLEKTIWEYHVNGLSIRNISTVLKKAKVRVTNRDFIHQIIKRLKQQMIAKYVKGSSVERI